MRDARWQADASDEVRAQAELDLQRTAPNQARARLPLAVCVPLIAALSLSGWAAIAVIFRAIR
jgi:hypothetical protein